MVDADIYREPTPEEKKDFVDLRSKKSKNVLTKFVEKLKDAEFEYNQARRPFCYRCADLDFKKQYQDKLSQLENTYGEDIQKTITIDVDKIDLKQYANPKAFKFGKWVNNVFKSNKIRVASKKKAVVNGVATEIQYGWTYNLTCQKKGCGIALDILFRDEAVFLKDMGMEEKERDKLLLDNPEHQAMLKEQRLTAVKQQ